MYCLSVSHKTSNVVVRKKLAFPDEQKKTFLDELFYSENISECLILCTCNRTEVYFCGDESSVKTVETVLSDFSGIDFDELKKYICLFYGDRACSIFSGWQAELNQWLSVKMKYSVS